MSILVPIPDTCELCFFFVVWGLYTGSVPTRVPAPGLPSQANAYARGSLC